MKLDEDLMRRMWPQGDSKVPGLVAAMAAQSEAVFAKYGITTALQVAHFMAQISLECNGGREVIENLDYTAGRISQVWPSRFPSVASAIPYAHNPKKLADKVYNGRMGNAPGSDDGYNFRGRGGTNTTGREAYEKLGDKFGYDLVDNPDLLIDPEHFLEFAIADFIMCGCLPFCEPKPGLPLGDIRAVTHHLNGGYEGLADRQSWFRRWWAVLKPADHPEAEPADGVLRYGVGHDAADFEVKALQEKLVALGYQVGSVDGDFGGGTRAAVLAFQADNGLATSGEVDAATKLALKTSPMKPISEKRANATVDDLRAAGSVTVAKGDSLTWWGKLTAGLGLAGAGGHAADSVGLLDNVKDATDKASTFRGVFDQVQDLSTWAIHTVTTYWWLAAFALGVFGVTYGGSIIRERLADHRSAANMKL